MDSLYMRLNHGQTGQSAHADPSPQLKASTMGVGATDLDHRVMEEDGLV